MPSREGITTATYLLTYFVMRDTVSFHREPAYRGIRKSHAISSVDVISVTEYVFCKTKDDVDLFENFITWRATDFLDCLGKHSSFSSTVVNYV